MMNPCAHDAAHPREGAPGCHLIRDLRLARTGEATFTGMTRSGRSSPGRSFGGGLIAQALLAAGATVPDGLAPGSLHAYFITPGDATRPMRYTVSAMGEAQSSALRQVTAEQDGTVRLAMQTSFRRFRSDPSPGHQRPSPHGPLTDPPDPAAAGEDCECAGGAHIPPCGLALRDAPEPGRPEPGTAPGAHRATWVRSRHDLGEFPLWHAALLAYASDVGSIGVVDLPHAGESGTRLAASVDHAVWFHRPFRFDGWLWYGQRSPVLTGGRGMFEGSFYDTGGRLVASVAQETAIRRISRPSRQA